MAEFLQYVEDTWIQGVGSEKLSVYKQKQRTCNHQESFHNLLRHLIRGPHPNIWRFTDALQKTENSNIEFYQSMLLGCPGGRGRSRTRMNLFLDKKIKRYTDQLDNEKTTVLEFLQIVSPCVYSYVDVELIPDGEEDVSDVFERDENHEESQGGQTLRMEMDVEITQIADSVEMEAGVQEIAGQKPNSTWYHINDGYFYTMSTTDKSRVYLRCRENKCKGRASMPVGNRSLETFKVTVPHIHDPDFFQLPILELRRKIMDRCSKEPTPFLTIWNEESAKIDSQLMTEIADRISYKSLKSAMHRARASKNVRVTPPTLLEFGEAVKKSPKFRKTVRGSDFYLATVESAEGGVSVILGSPEFVLLLPEVEELHLDGTFDVPPMEPPAHLLTIMLTIKSHAFPVFFILMEKNNEAAYNDVFEFIKEKVPSLNPSVFITNFDRAIQDCLSNQFPGKEIVGSWFHAAMDMRKTAGRFGLGNLLKDSPFAKTVLKMGMALPLLPSRKIANGFNVITRFAVENGVYDRMERFLQYLECAWIKAVGPEKLSVYRQKERTIIMDHQESFHHSLRDLMTKGFKPNIWSFTESIRMTENLNFEKYQSMLHDPPSGRPKSQRNLMQDKRVKCVMDQLDDGEATVLEFLQKTSNCIDDIINVENISIKEEVEEETREEGVTEVTKTDENDVEVGGEGEHFLASENTLMNDGVAEIEETIEEADFAVNMLQGMNERPDEVYIVYM
ncbi:uncharacterized protein LOC111045813 [Nilaparvata lugens]|uniref:uncharacterized protein LOC111045813 n=1 Tax=Nilaparvata lugens TaxID=108931 RepID=UPI00193E32DF|nr:uncharacterized protein LOC111045813 [Nilaparvata lugens]